MPVILAVLSDYVARGQLKWVVTGCASEGLRLRLTRVFYMQFFSVEERQTHLDPMAQWLEQCVSPRGPGFDS